MILLSEKKQSPRAAVAISAAAAAKDYIITFCRTLCEQTTTTIIIYMTIKSRDYEREV